MGSEAITWACHTVDLTTSGMDLSGSMILKGAPFSVTAVHLAPTQGRQVALLS